MARTPPAALPAALNVVRGGLQRLRTVRSVGARTAPDGRFAPTRVGRALVSDDPARVVPMIAFIGDPAHREHRSHLEHSARTGQTAVGKVRRIPFFPA